MKFDSYQRFLKSDIYKDCALLELQGKALPYEQNSDMQQCDTNNNNKDTPCPVDPDSGNGFKPALKAKRKSLIPWSRLKSSIISNHKAASLSSMPSKEASFKRPLMMRKITNSITKIRSKSLDEHITNHIKQVDSQSSASIDKPVNQKSLNLCDSRNSLIANNSDSLDLSETSNVFSPSPDNNETVYGLGQLSSEPGESNQAAGTSNVFNNHNCKRDDCHFLRIVFPDHSQTVVSSSPNESLESLIQRLVDKRCLKYSAFDVFTTGNELVIVDYARMQSSFLFPPYSL